MSHWSLWHKKEKMQVLYTNQMYPSSVVSNVKVKRKHRSLCLYTKHKNTFKNKKQKQTRKNQYFSLPFHTPLIYSVCMMSSSVTDRGHGYIHILTEYLIK